VEISQTGSDPLRGSLDFILWHRLDSARNDITGCTIDVVFSSWLDAQLLFDASVDVMALLSLEWTQWVVSGASSGYDKVTLRVEGCTGSPVLYTDEWQVDRYLGSFSIT
jgi:hypothetical protein